MQIRTLLFALVIQLFTAASAVAQAKSGPTARALPPTGGDFALRFDAGEVATDFIQQLEQAAAVPLDFSAAHKVDPAAHSAAASAFVTEGSPRTLARLTHQRYRQTLGGFPVVGAEFVTHANDNGLLSVNGRFYRAQVLAQAPTFSASNAIGVARAAHHRTRTATAHATAGKTLRASRAEASTPELVYVDLAYPAFTGRLALAWQVRVATPGTPDGRAYFLDATDGRLLHEFSTVAHGTVPGSVPTNYYGRQEVPVTQTATGFDLLDEERGIFVSQNSGDQVSSPTATFETQDERFGRMAFDIYFGADRMYDLLVDRYDWRGIDGDGEAFQGVADDAPYTPFVNAYWDGESATFGQGDCYYLPLTSIDVVGHEFAHGITNRTSDLVYAGESGALNEAFSDIFGKSLERVVAPDQFNWELGNRFAASPYAEGFRSMSDPTLFGNPKEVDGPLWRDGADVHYNSGPLNHWFYLLVEGGSGTTSTDLPYAVDAIGLDAALEHAFVLNTTYLTPTSTYYDAYEASLLLATDSYGAASPELAAIAQAWLAIGLPQSGSTGTTGDDLELVFADMDDFCQDAENVELFVVYRYTGEPRSDAPTIGLELRALPSQRLVGTYTIEPFSLESGSYEIEYLDIPTADLFPLSDEGFGVRLVLGGDTNPANDSAEAFVELFPTGLQLAIDEVVPSFTPCYGNDIGFEVSFENKGCQSVDRPVTLTFADRDGNTLGTTTVDLTGLRAGDFGMRQLVELDEDWARRAVRVSATTPGDSADEDNAADLQNEPEAALPTGLTLTASNASDEAYVKIWEQGVTLGTVARANTRDRGAAWVSSGEGSSVYQAPCNDPAFAAQSGYAAPPALLLCIDNSSGDASSLDFDASALVGRPSTTFTELDGYRNTIAVRYGDHVSQAPVYYQSPSSEAAARVSVPIPAGYSGPIVFELSNTTGTEDWLSRDPDLSQFDYWVIDNISLRNASGVTEVEGSLRLSPNPTRHGFELALPQGGGSEPATLRVFDALGRQQYAEQISTVAGATHVRTSEWLPGLYTVTVEHPGGSRSVARVVVQ